MRRHRPDLIVPIRDRRRRRRLLTVRNVTIASAALVVVFAAITIRSELRDQPPSERLWSRGVVPVEQKPVEIVREERPEIEDHMAADPMLVAPAAREQWLHSEPTTAAAVDPERVADAVARQKDADSRVTIVGGPGGVAVVQRDRQEPVLRGGFGRSPSH